MDVLFVINESCRTRTFEFLRFAPVRAEPTSTGRRAPSRAAGFDGRKSWGIRLFVINESCRTRSFEFLRFAPVRAGPTSTGRRALSRAAGDWQKDIPL